MLIDPISRMAITHFDPDFMRNKAICCDKSYSDPNSIPIHQRKHTGERPYSCGICPESFTDHAHKRYHIMTRHPH